MRATWLLSVSITLCLPRSKLIQEIPGMLNHKLEPASPSRQKTQDKTTCTILLPHCACKSLADQPYPCSPALLQGNPAKSCKIQGNFAYRNWHWETGKAQQLQWSKLNLHLLNHWHKHSLPHVGNSGLGRGIGYGVFSCHRSHPHHRPDPPTHPSRCLFLLCYTSPHPSPILFQTLHCLEQNVLVPVEWSRSSHRPPLTSHLDDSLRQWSTLSAGTSGG